MKYLKSYAILENNDTKPLYPFEKIYPIFKWFVNNYGDKIYREGWVLRISQADFDLIKWRNPHGKVFIVESTYSKNNNRGNPLTEQEAYKYATKYGFKINEEGIIIDFDINEYNKIKHLLTGHQLGLL